jgi:hypothetical protein
LRWSSSPKAANLVDGDAAIGDAVRITWLDRGQAPPLPVVAPA